MNEEKFRQSFKGKKVLITGHSGFKGSWLTKILLEFGAKVVGISLEPNTEPNLFSVIDIKDRITNYFVDIREYDKVRSIIEKEKPEFVFHLAAQPLVRDSYDDPLRTFSTNSLGTANILDAIRHVKSVRAAVMITTDKVYENKEWIWAYRENDELGGYDPYSSSKACAELIIKSYSRSFFNPDNYGTSHKTLVASARAGNVIGGGDWSKDRLIPDIVRSIFIDKKKLILRSPSAIRPWQHVLEPLTGYMMLAIQLHSGNKEFTGPWNFAPNPENFVSVENLVKKAINFSGTGEYEVQKDVSKHETSILKLDSTKARECLDWKPVLGMDQVVDWTFTWYKTFYAGKDIDSFTQKQIKEYYRLYFNGTKN